MGFWAELHRRSVFRVAGVYAVVGWLIAQIAVVLETSLGLPAWFDGAVVAALLLGFPIALVLAWAFELTPEGVRRATPAAADTDAPPPRLARIDVLILIAIAALVGVSIFQTVRPRPDVELAGAPATPTAVDDRVSLAVLPFADISPEHDQEYFSDGLSEELLNQLAQLDGLRVIARTSSWAFKGQNPDLREVGEILGVANILEGSVRKADDQLRITAQLIDATDGSHIWSETYDRTLEDVFAIQEEISVDVARELSVRLGVGEAPSRTGGTTNVEAYDAYLRGRAEGINGSVQGSGQAIAELRHAVELDPDFAQAWVELSSNYAGLVAVAPTAEAQSRLKTLGKAASDRALELAPDMWESQVLRGWGLAGQRRWAEADATFTRAQELADAAGAYMGTYRWAFLWETGRLSEALSYIETTRANDPLALGSRSGEDNVLYMLGRRAEPSDAMDGPSLILRLLHAMDGQDEDAVEAIFGGLVPAAPAAPATPLLALRDVWRSPEDALAVIRERTQAPGFHPALELMASAMFAGSYGDADLSVELLRKALIDGDLQIGRSFMWAPQMRGVRRTEAFKEFLRDYGYVDLWRETGRWGDFCHPVGEDDFACE